MALVKVIQGSFHQGHKQFGETAGKQCTCCSLFSVVFSIVKNPGSWDTIDLDYVLKNGTEIYRGVNKDGFLMFSELPREINILESKFYIEFLENDYGLLHYYSVYGSLIDRKSLSISDGFLLIVNKKCISVMWNKRAFFLYDSHSKNNQGKSSPDGTATLIKFNSLKALENYIFQTYSMITEDGVEYELQYISVNKDNLKATPEAYYAYRERIRKSTPDAQEKSRKRNATSEAQEKARKRNATHDCTTEIF